MVGLRRVPTLLVLDIPMRIWLEGVGYTFIIKVLAKLFFLARYYVYFKKLGFKGNLLSSVIKSGYY